MPAPEDSKTEIRPSDETTARPAAPSSRLDSSVRFTPGTLVAGRYRIVSPLGKGGMGLLATSAYLSLGGKPVFGKELLD